MTKFSFRRRRVSMPALRMGVAAIILTALFGSKSIAESAEQMFDRLVKAFETPGLSKTPREDTQAHMRNFEMFLKRNPIYPRAAEARVYLAEAQWRLAMVSEGGTKLSLLESAIQNCRKGSQMAGGRVREAAMRVWLNCAVDKGDMSTAIRLGRSLAEESNDWTSLAWALQQEGKPLEAAPLYKRVMGIAAPEDKPRFAAAVAQCFSRGRPENWDLAALYYDKASELATACPKSHVSPEDPREWLETAKWCREQIPFSEADSIASCFVGLWQEGLLDRMYDYLAESWREEETKEDFVGRLQSLQTQQVRPVEVRYHNIRVLRRLKQPPPTGIHPGGLSAERRQLVEIPIKFEKERPPRFISGKKGIWLAEENGIWKVLAFDQWGWKPEQRDR